MGMQMNEVWKDLPGYEGYYRVSSHGRVYSVCRVVVRNREGYRPQPFCVPPTIMRQSTYGNGYKKVGLRKDGVRVSAKVHRLIALAFVPNPHGYKHVNHIDFDASNNRADNLEWCTPSQNHRHSAVHGRRGRKLNPIAVRIIRRCAEKRVPDSVLSDLFGVSAPSVRNVRLGIDWGWVDTDQSLISVALAAREGGAS